MVAMSSLFDWARGEAAFTRLINAFYDRVEADELLSPVFPGGVREEHRLHVIAWWCEVFGGPAREQSLPAPLIDSPSGTLH
jgi:hemoglobin